MELDERKVTILKAIIKNYMDTGEPVGSRTISKYVESRWSSATIRNEMSDLEEMGYIIQPHTSAGRIPSDKGYRFYVDQIMQEKDSEVAEIQELMIQRVDRLESVLKKLAKLLARDTNYAALISGPRYHENKLKFIQLSRVDEELLNLNILLNSNLNGLTIEEINLAVIARMKEQAGSHGNVVDLVLNQVAEVIRADSEDLQIYTSGATNIFKYPELSDNQKASELLSTLEHTEELQELVNGSLGEEKGTGIQVYIGEESPVQAMRDCSVITANYEMGEGIRGTIGIIGPKRMDYEKVLKTLRTVMTQRTKTGPLRKESRRQRRKTARRRNRPAPRRQTSLQGRKKTPPEMEPLPTDPMGTVRRQAAELPRILQRQPEEKRATRRLPTANGISLRRKKIRRILRSRN